MSPVTTRLVDNDTLCHVTLEAGKGNVLSMAVGKELEAAFQHASGHARIKAVILGASGGHFSFGASVEEHLPDRAAGMLAGFHALLRTVVRCPVPVLVAVRGRCLGGGLELALAGTRIFASEDALLGQPEIKLGVIAPAASILLPYRVRRPVADELLLSGRSIGAKEALELGVVDHISADPDAAAYAWVKENLGGLPVAAVRNAVAAARGEYAAEVCRRIEGVEQLYLQQVKDDVDAIEGLKAFIEKRPARYQNV